MISRQMPTTHLASSPASGRVVPGAEQAIPAPREIEEVMPTVYEELRRLATSYLRGERAEHTLQATALVHEAYLRLSREPEIEWQNPAHFIGIFARVMRQTLTNYAIAKGRLKRGGPDKLQSTLEFYESRRVDVAAVDEALQQLEALDRRQAQVVELRFFGGLTIDEIAQVLAISPATVKREWDVAKVWLRRELSSGA